jgi:hypothetical protein
VGCDRIMKWLEPKFAPALSLGRVEPDVAWYRGCLAHCGDAAAASWWAVQIDQQARIAGKKQGCIEQAGNASGHFGRSYVPGNVTIKLGGRQTKAGITCRKKA